MDKIKISKKELKELYEVEEDLTQPNIEDNIDQPETVLNEEEQAHDDEMMEEFT